MLLVIVQESEKLVVFSLMLIIDLVPVIVLRNEGFLLYLVLKTLRPRYLGLKEMEKNVGV